MTRTAGARATSWLAAAALTALLPSVARAQSVDELTIRLSGMTAVSGYERAMAGALLELLPGSRRDRAGNVILELGDSGPRRLAVCPMDEWGYVIGGIQPGGYLTLRRVGRGQPTFFDQWHEGHRVTIWGDRGPVPAVVGVPSVHLMRRGTIDRDRLFEADDARVDMGAGSPEEVRAAGVDLLDPVALEKAPHRYGDDLVAAPEAGERGACAALIAAARAGRVRGRVVVAFAVESRIGHRGLGTVVNLDGPFEETLMVDYPAPRGFPLTDRMGEVTHLDLETRYEGLAIETISLAEVRSLSGRIASWMGGGP